MARRSEVAVHRAIKWAGWVIATAVIFGGGCTFDSSLQGVQCNQEGARSNGRLCQNGHWISEADAELDGHTPGDATDTPLPDDASDVPQDITPDADDCPQGQVLCDGQCVDKQRSEDHCGACGQACNTYGTNSAALCAQGTCERTCQEGYVDLDGDWIGTDDPAASNGCEVECSPTNGGTEICDGLDNDCDGDVDEGVETTYYLDADDDGYGVTGDSQNACSPTGNYRATDEGDCNDGAALVNPGATESCNGFDDDCDGDTDEECPCSGNESTSCYTGPQGTEGVGECAQGNKTCNGSGEWGECLGEVTPDVEVCDDGEDDDCDGLTDCEDDDCAAQSCGSNGEVCHNDVCCMPQNDRAFCNAQGAQCGRVSGVDNCGVQRTDVNCGGCGGGASCANNTCHEDANKCGDGNDNDGDGLFDCEDDDCAAQSCGGDDVCYMQSCCTPDMQAFCTAQGAQCGTVSGTDNCGIQHAAYDCGGCPGGSSCSSNTCVETSCDDGQDNDGDGAFDCDDSDCPGTLHTYYYDDDGDGYGVSTNYQVACGADGKYSTQQPGDCDDSHDKTYPSAASQEPNSHECMRDDDGDGWGDMNPGTGVVSGTDCDDTDDMIHPGATEECGDDTDSDCDGTADENDTDADTWCGDPSGGDHGNANCAPTGNTSCCSNPGGNCH